MKIQLLSRGTTPEKEFREGGSAGMYYCLVDFLALLVLLITNHDVLQRDSVAADRSYQGRYRMFLLAVISYYIVDAIWAWLYELQKLTWLYVDTEIYFIVMAAGIWLWLRYVVAYLGIKNIFSQLFCYSGQLLFAMVLIVTVLNRWWSCMFWFDEAGVYHGGLARDTVFVYQILILLLISLYTLCFASHCNEKQRKRYYTIGLSGFIMLVLVAIQIFFPTYPLYAISYMLGCCLLRTFVVENEREEYRNNLELALEREKEQFQEYKRTWKLAYNDALTGVKSKRAFMEHEELLDWQMAQKVKNKLAIIVFDVNNLKQINDTLGHDEGDRYIKEACKIICDIFKKSPVYRVGGDEFVAVLENDDFDNREQLQNAFNQIIEKNLYRNDVVVAMGMAEYVPTEDECCRQIFERADQRMYARKRQLKKFTSPSPP